MSNLYEKISPGDRRTIVKKFPKGEKLYFSDKSAIVLKAHVAMKVVQEYDPLVGRGDWVDKSYMLESMVEIDNPYERPPPTSMPGPSCDHVAAMATDKPCPVCFPEARVNDNKLPWWRRWFGKHDFPFGEGE